MSDCRICTCEPRPLPCTVHGDPAPELVGVMARLAGPGIVVGVRVDIGQATYPLGLGWTAEAAEGFAHHLLDLVAELRKQLKGVSSGAS